MPDSTSGELRSRDSTSASNSSSSSSSSTGDEDDDTDHGSELNIGGCSSGCCLAASPRPRCDVANLKDVEEEKEEAGPSDAIEKVSSKENPVEEGDVLENFEKAEEGAKRVSESKSFGKSAALNLRSGEEKESVQEEKDEDNLSQEENKSDAARLTEEGKGDQIPEVDKSCPKVDGEIVLKKDLEANEKYSEEVKEQIVAVQKKERSGGNSSKDCLSKS